MTHETVKLGLQNTLNTSKTTRVYFGVLHIMVWKMKNPYTHIRDFEEVCTTFKEGMMDMDLLKLKAFPLTLKDKAKIWLNSLRPRAIRNWAELQAEFLKKFFSAHKTNNLKR